MRLKNYILVIALSLLFVACEETAIVHDLQERDANEILVALNKHGIHAEKEKVEKNQEIKWSIKVKPADEQTARDILVANNLPKVRQMGLEGICKDAGLILTPKTEKCREILAFKGEIINSLESIPGVVSADVVLNLPDKEDFPDENVAPPRPTAAVTIQYLNDGLTPNPLTEGKVQEFVSNSVSELDPRDVAVIISYLSTITNSKGIETTSVTKTKTEPDAIIVNTDQIEVAPAANMTSIAGLKMDPDSAKKFKVIGALFLILFMVMAGSLIFVLLRMSQLRKKAPITTEELEANEQKLLAG